LWCNFGDLLLVLVKLFIARFNLICLPGFANRQIETHGKRLQFPYSLGHDYTMGELAVISRKKWLLQSLSFIEALLLLLAATRYLLLRWYLWMLLQHFLLSTPTLLQ